MTVRTPFRVIYPPAPPPSSELPPKLVDALFDQAALRRLEAVREAIAAERRQLEAHAAALRNAMLRLADQAERRERGIELAKASEEDPAELAGGSPAVYRELHRSYPVD